VNVRATAEPCAGCVECAAYPASGAMTPDCVFVNCPRILPTYAAEAERPALEARRMVGACYPPHETNRAPGPAFPTLDYPRHQHFERLGRPVDLPEAMANITTCGSDCADE
jgi:hypothetical protein